MITYLTHDRIDKVRWDDCIANAVNGLVYAWSWYLDIVHPKWEALVEIVDDRYLTVMPITKKKKWFVNYICQPFFVQQLGVFSRHPITAEITNDFLMAIPKKFLLTEIRLNEQNPLPDGYQGIEFHQNHLLSLGYDYNSLYNEYHDNTKRNLKKSSKYNLALVPLSDVRPIIALFRADRGAMISHWGDPEYTRLARLSDRAITSSNAFIYGVKNIDNDSIICGALFMVSHGRITFLFSGNSDVGKSCQAMTFLLDRVIAAHASSSMIFDFEGSDDVNLARFYQGFGAHAVSYSSYQHYFSRFFSR